MDFTTLLIGLVVIAVCAVPVVLLSNTNKKQGIKLFKRMQKEVSKMHCQLTLHDVCGDFMLGMDEPIRKVFFLKELKYDMIFQVLDLNDMSQCKVILVDRSIGKKSSETRVTERIELQFTPKDKGKSVVSLLLYEANDNPVIGDELLIANKWAERIQYLLK